jgi:RNA polymerase sigma factor (sigma-70 family)
MAMLGETWATSDADLVDRVREGDLDGYDELFQRHGDRARRVARAVLDNPTDADDVVSEAFAAVLAALQRGKGPRYEFAGYLVSAVRHEAYRTNRRRGRVHPVAEHGDEALAATVTPEDADILRTAFESLPTVDRQVLWRTEIEGLSHADIARDDGSTVQAIAARASRARHALRGAYLAEHVGLVFTEPPATPQCADTRRQLAQLVRGRVSVRRQRRLEGHLAECAACREGRDRLERLNERLRTAPPLGPLAAGGVTVTRIAAEGTSLVARLAALVSPAVAVTALAAVTVLGPTQPTTEAVAGNVETAADASTITSSLPLAPTEALTGPGAATALSGTGTTTDGVFAPGDGTLTSDPVVEVPTSPTANPTATALSGSGVGSAPSVPTSSPSAVLPPVAVPPGTIGPVPVGSVPPVAVAPVTIAPVAVPRVTVPPITVPAVTVPPVTVPAVTSPPVTVPPAPPVTTPAVTTPAVTVPPVTTPPATAPAVTVPPQSEPTTVPPIVGGGPLGL